jgi:hypothetical protein
MSRRGFYKASSLDEARVRYLRAHWGSSGRTLCDGCYKDFAQRGLSKAEVNRALDILTARGEAALCTIAGYGIGIRLVSKP